MIKTAVIGCGHWGRLVIRSLSQNDGFHLRYFCDIDVAKVDGLKNLYGYVNGTTDLDAVLRDVAVDAVVVATPTQTHHEIALRCLRAGKHVLIEQPMAISQVECDDLIQTAEQSSLTLAVNHIDQHNLALSKLSSMVETGGLGAIRYMYAQRLNLGESTSRSGALYELGSHEIYTCLNILGLTPTRVTAKGLHLMSKDVEDVAFATIDFEEGCTLNLHTSWLDPNKVRRLTIVGSDRMAVYDDVSQDARITVYNRSADLEKTVTDGNDSFDQFQLSIRSGDVLIPRVEFVEPLKLACESFRGSVTDGHTPAVDGKKARRVVALLEASRKSMQMNGAPVHIKEWA